MLKFFGLTTISSVVLMLFLPGIGWSNPLPVTFFFPTVVNSGSDNLLCYMKTEDGQILNLDSLCKTTTNSMQSSGVRESESNLGNSFSNQNQSSNNNFAATQCNVIDANGLPCSTEGD
jgi:hypothetical protein